MNAILIERAGGSEVLRLREVPTPEPKAGEALVRLHAAGVNFIDVYQRTGAYKVAYPFVPGREGAGVVEAVGPGVESVVPGERVAFVGSSGAYAEYAAVPEGELVRIPEGVSYRQAAALMLQGMTAHYLAISTYPLAAGRVALVHAAAGGVGLLLTQLANAAGATVIATVSTQAKSDLARAAGAHIVVDYTHENFATVAREATNGRGVDVVYDSVGKATYERSLEALRPRGTFVLFGASSGAVPPLDLQILNAKGSLFATRPKLDDYIATRAELVARADDLFERIEDGSLHLRIEHIYPLADAARAHDDLESRRTTGKLVLLP